MTPDTPRGPARIRIPAGTVVAEQRVKNGQVEEHALSPLLAETWVQATRVGETWIFSLNERVCAWAGPLDAGRFADAALVGRIEESTIGGRPYLTGLIGSRLVESLDGGDTWQYWMAVAMMAIIDL